MTSSLSSEWSYAHLRPDQLEARIAQCPVAYVPWGALEWHSVHLPVGLDGLVAAAIAERAVQRTGGVVLPAMYLPITALPHRFSISFRAATVRPVLDDLFAELARIGVRAIVVLSGHYAQSHELVLIDAAEHALATHGLPVLATPPLALLGEEYLDHAGRWETAQMLATDPWLVDLQRFIAALRQFPAGHVADLGVLGELPIAATAAGGEIAIEEALAEIEQWVRRLLDGDSQALRDFYRRRRAAYESFRKTYLGDSYEDAAAAWWADRLRRD